MITLCLATNNRHKIEELQQMLGDKYILKTLEDIGCCEDIEETGSTFEENALIKAQYVFDKYGFDTLADDSGLEIEALNNEPGVFSARYAGEPSHAGNNIKKVLANLTNIANRKAKFRTVIALVLKGKSFFFEGEIIGTITEKALGNDGFGYDPIFIPSGHKKTFAEMGPSDKNQISHRALATKNMMPFLEAYFSKI
jgi:XTP/dITP diphosphohydrolase